MTRGFLHDSFRVFLCLHLRPGILVIGVSTADIHIVTSSRVDAGNERNSLFLLDWTEEDPGVDHDSVEVTVNLGDTLHGTRTSHEGFSLCRGRRSS